MLNLLGYVLLTALTVVLVTVVARAGAPQGAPRTRLAAGVAAWFLAAASLGALGVFSSPVLPPTVAVAIAVILPIVIGAGAVARSRGLGLPLTALIGLNAGRMVGIAFLLLYSAGRLPYSFSHSAGIGDIAVSVLSFPVMWAVRNQVAGWRWLAGAWNLLGMTDLIVAVALGAGSAVGSPLRFVFESPGSNQIATLPWVLVPAFFVPFYLLTHIAVFAKIVETARVEHRPVAKLAA